MSKLGLLIGLGLCLTTMPTFAETVLCAPIAVSEMVGEAGPMTISASNPDFGNPVIFWIDTETGQMQEHFDQGSTYITGEIQLQVADGGKATGWFEGVDTAQDEHFSIDLSIDVHPFYRSVNGALTAIGTCTASPMGVIPAEADAPTWPFPYSGGSKAKTK